MSNGLDEINNLINRIHRGETVTIIQLKALYKLVQDRELYFMIQCVDAWERIEKLEKLKERRVQPQQVKKEVSRRSFSLVGRSTPQKRDDGLTDEFRAFLHKERANTDTHKKV